MNWNRVRAARRLAKGMFLAAGLLILVAVFYFVAAPSFSGGTYEEQTIATVPLSVLVTAIGFGGVLFGLGWMWRIWRAPTRFDEPRWRYRDR
jgi:uncharacterized membrane protein